MINNARGNGVSTDSRFYERAVKKKVLPAPPKKFWQLAYTSRDHSNRPSARLNLSTAFVLLLLLLLLLPNLHSRVRGHCKNVPTMVLSATPVVLTD